MGEDHLTASETAHDSTHDEVCRGSAGFVGIVNDRLRQFGVDEIRVYSVGWVYEDDTAAAVKLFPQRKEIRVSEIAIGCAVAGVKCDSIGLELVQGVGQFFESGRKVVGQGWQCCEEPKLLGTGIANSGRMLIDGSGKLRGGSAFENCAARCSKGQDSRTDALRGHQGSTAVWAPCWKAPSRWVST